MATRQTKKPAAKKAPAKKAKSTVYSVHKNANDNGFGYYHVSVIRVPQNRIHNARLWLRIADVRDARRGSSTEFRQSLREQITLNIINVFHWNPMPQGEELAWRRIKLVRIDPPPKP